MENHTSPHCTMWYGVRFIIRKPHNHTRMHSNFTLKTASFWLNTKLEVQNFIHFSSHTHTHKIKSSKVKYYYYYFVYICGTFSLLSHDFFFFYSYIFVLLFLLYKLYIYIFKLTATQSHTLS